MPGRGRRHTVGAGKLEADKRKPVEAWEDQVFADAAEFTVTQFLGQGQRNTRRFTVEQFAEALAAARAMPAPGAKPYALYVVSKLGRSVCLERNKDEHWKQLWATHHATA